MIFQRSIAGRRRSLAVRLGTLVLALLGSLLPIASAQASLPAAAQPVTSEEPALPALDRDQLLNFGIVRGQGGVGRNEGGDFYGSSVAVGDFNGDGAMDAAGGVPHEAIGHRARAGTVIVDYGTPLFEGGNQGWLSRFPINYAPDRTLLSQAGPLPGAAEFDDRFGAALAVGDFDGDGLDDLAVGAPSEDIGSVTDAGIVVVFFGTGGGLGERAMILSENMNGHTRSEELDWFGAALAAGDVDGDGRDELAVGGTGDTIYGNAEAGMVSLFSFAPTAQDSGAEVAWAQAFHRAGGTMGMLTGANSEASFFGSSLTIADFDLDGYGDLVVGAPFVPPFWAGGAGSGSEVGGVGEVLVLAGSAEGLTNRHRLIQDAQPGSLFGYAVAAAAHPSAPGLVQLAVGSPARDIAPGGTLVSDAGAVVVFDGVLDGAANDVLGPADGLVLHQSVAVDAVQPDAAGTDDYFGWSVVLADLDRDGWNEVVSGAPGDTMPRGAAAGTVSVFWGSADGPEATSFQTLAQGPLEMGFSLSGEFFGFAIAAGDLASNGVIDLVVGSPGEARGGPSAGVVGWVLNGFVRDSYPRGRLPVVTVQGPFGGQRDFDLPVGWLPALGEVFVRACAVDADEYWEPATLDEMLAACPDVVGSFVVDDHPADNANWNDRTVPLSLAVPDDGLVLYLHSDYPAFAFQVPVKVADPQVIPGPVHLLGPHEVEIGGASWVANSTVKLYQCGRDFGWLAQRPGVDPVALLSSGVCLPRPVMSAVSDANGEFAVDLGLVVSEPSDVIVVGHDPTSGLVSWEKVVFTRPTIRVVERPTIRSAGIYQVKVVGEQFLPSIPVRAVQCSLASEGENSAELGCDESTSQPIAVAADGTIDASLDIVVSAEDLSSGQSGLSIVAGEDPSAVSIGFVEIYFWAPRVFAYWHDDTDGWQLELDASDWPAGDPIALYLCPPGTNGLPLDEQLALCGEPVAQSHPRMRGWLSVQLEGIPVNAYDVVGVSVADRAFVVQTTTELPFAAVRLPSDRTPLVGIQDLSARLVGFVDGPVEVRSCVSPAPEDCLGSQATIADVQDSLSEIIVSVFVSGEEGANPTWVVATNELGQFAAAPIWYVPPELVVERPDLFQTWPTDYWGLGWPAGSVTVVLCPELDPQNPPAASAVDVATDCDAATAVSFDVHSDGSFAGAVEVAWPAEGTVLFARHNQSDDAALVVVRPRPPQLYRTGEPVVGGGEMTTTVAGYGWLPSSTLTIETCAYDPTGTVPCVPGTETLLPITIEVGDEGELPDTTITTPLVMPGVVLTFTDPSGISQTHAVMVPQDELALYSVPAKVAAPGLHYVQLAGNGGGGTGVWISMEVLACPMELLEIGDRNICDPIPFDESGEVAVEVPLGGVWITLIGQTFTGEDVLVDHHLQVAT